MTTSDFDRFDQLTRKLLKVPHSEIKAKLEEEKAVKRQKKAARRASPKGDK